MDRLKKCRQSIRESCHYEMFLQSTVHCVRLFAFCFNGTSSLCMKCKGLSVGLVFNSTCKESLESSMLADPDWPEFFISPDKYQRRWSRHGILHKRRVEPVPPGFLYFAITEVCFFVITKASFFVVVYFSVLFNATVYTVTSWTVCASITEYITSRLCFWIPARLVQPLTREA